MTASLSGAALNLVLNYFFLNPRWCNFGYVAAGYTTLICYILYALGHYICMRRVCKKHLDNVRVYDPRILLGVSVCFIAAGMLLSTTYDVPVLRYSLTAAVAVLLIIFRKRVAAYAKKLNALRKPDGDI